MPGTDYERVAISIGVRDLGQVSPTVHVDCGNVHFRYGIKPDGTIVEYCPHCGEIDIACNMAKCPCCGASLDPGNLREPHFHWGNQGCIVICPHAPPPP